jgi:hypothetical protein
VIETATWVLLAALAVLSMGTLILRRKKSAPVLTAAERQAALAQVRSWTAQGADAAQVPAPGDKTGKARP